MIDLAAPFGPLCGVSLSPITASDKEGLRAVANSEETWKWYTFRADGEHFDTQYWSGFAARHNPPSECHFVVRLNGKTVGATCLLHVDSHHKRLEIGGTWYHADVRGTQVNPACKLLLIRRAFEWGAQRVEINTDSNNVRSRAAIEKLGAKYDGTLRNHKYLHDGSVRHTVCYSIISEEWPEVEAKLEERIRAFDQVS